MQEKPEPVYAEPGHARIQALRMAWPIVCRRLEEFPTINAMQLFEELCIQFPGRFTRKVRAWCQQAVQQLIGEVSGLPPYVASYPSRLATGNILGEAAGNKIT